MTFEEAIAISKEVQSGCDEEEHRFWWRQIVEELPPIPRAIVLEIGSSGGGGSATLLQAIMAKSTRHHELGIEWRLDCMDAWTTGYTRELLEPGYAGRGGETLLNTLKVHVQHMIRVDRAVPGARNHVRHLVAESLDFLEDWQPRSPVIFVLLDGGKWKLQQAKEFDRLAAFVAPGGIILQHDTNDDSGGTQSAFAIDLRAQAMGFEPLLMPMEPKKGPDNVPYRCGWRTKGWRKTGWVRT